ncbi:MBL fold metallo-hydrolase [Piscinibacter terrae]|uniref:MBL fold metallo-hydrolase n=1 Tax=Piscinibacter terrae TaxID=2496871 RepID=A0A3N7HLI7_9BURK|nr:MBL fold metallo-hydrolase [Albitalea terrae]RQP22977.1 MBL fold metallo-hydrolase [Albitalea terrae]
MTPDLPLPAAADLTARPPRPAATLVLLRDGADGVQVLLLQRAERGDHNSGAWVFPGGLVDKADALLHGLVDGLTPAQAADQLKLAEGALDYAIAAMRECFEECGLLFGVDAETAASLEPWRGPIHRGEKTLLDLHRETGVRLDLREVAYLSHWLTPLGRAKRFDTRFFIAAAPHGQVARHDGTEMTAHRWMRIPDALAEGDALKLMGPTRATLMSLAHFKTVAEVMAWARSPREVPRIFPRIGEGAQGQRPVMPDEHAWAELGRLDPQGLGTAWYDIVADRAVRLSPRIIRVTAGNASVMTGPGTNSYLVGGGPRNEWSVIDPGPVDEAHVQALVAAAPGPITRILVTHTHSDHSPACVALKAATGAITLGRIADFADRQDKTFVPDQPLQGDERIVIDDGTTLRVIHTPGHASNHLCYLLEEENTLFTGDHVMQSSTVVINPPDGDMAAYVASLRSLAQMDGIDWLAPGHGFLMEQPRRAFEWIVRHRLQREAKVLEALQAGGPADADQLLAQVYDDVTPRLHAIAMRSLLAHLYKLRGEGRAVEENGRWRVIATGPQEAAVSRASA